MEGHKGVSGLADACSGDSGEGLVKEKRRGGQVLNYRLDMKFFFIPL